ncbi:MAG: exonuclease domain-containing protein [Sulfuricurvum sp.]|uniref:exonuclease domain-containing protein n=1 Tax=Sulfuricurvum sp. TaxID=2025608 RepID=UPI0026295618|nr:exonuclease domain-containing protein [Sulfuricurvum sp.]MDD2829957.1 exonuclease domain-containing protein [Sulfuricurvum sp.]
MLVFIDTETTGLETTDRICSVAIIGDELTHYEVINPGKKIPPSASAIHHITNEMVKEAPIFNHSCSFALLEELNTHTNILVSHNAPFDLSMLQKEGITWQGSVIDTLKCSKALMDDLEGYSLQFLRYECRLYRQEKEYFVNRGVTLTPHHSLSDALHTKMMFEYLLDLASIDELIEMSQKRLLLNRLPFGKYAKKRIEEIATKDPAYLKWMVESLMDMDEDLRYSCHYYLNKV